MRRIAHRGGMRKGFQNSPVGIRLAIHHKADMVELDVVKGADEVYFCGHGLGGRTLLEDCLAEVGGGLDLIVHLKGRFADTDLLRLVDQIVRHVSLGRVIFASHDGGVLQRLHDLHPSASLARFGLFPAMLALWRRPAWDCCMINQLVLRRSLVRALQRRGYLVFSSCVWEFRSREAVRNLGVDGAFVNLYE